MHGRTLTNSERMGARHSRCTRHPVRRNPSRNRLVCLAAQRLIGCTKQKPRSPGASLLLEDRNYYGVYLVTNVDQFAKVVRCVDVLQFDTQMFPASSAVAAE